MQNKRLFFLVCCILIVLVCGSFFAVKLISNHSRANVYTEMQKDNENLEKKEEQKDDQGNAEKEAADIPIDFAKLQNQNADIYGWIRIPGTVVDYPIVQHATDDSYYLNHTVEGRKGYPGSIYTQTVNNKDFKDSNTLIYGHNMRNGSMFGDLSLYKSSTYMKEHANIIIYTPEHIYTYQVFAAITYDNRHIMYAFDFSKEEGVQQFLDSLTSVRNMSSYIDRNVEVTSSDKLITLSTCNGNDKQRFLVGAVLINEQ